MENKSHISRSTNLNRGTRIRGVKGISFFLLLSVVLSMTANAQRLSRDLQVDVWVNQAGYLPNAAKTCIAKGDTDRKFEVINITTAKVVLSGTMEPFQGDFGHYVLGDFSSVSQPGHYYVKSGTLRSYPFEISNACYQPVMNKIVHYFSRQRCGASTTGYLSPCHTDDGIRMDNGKHQDVSGGWHDASDLRKWVIATIYGMIGLGKTLELRPDQNREAIIEELLWGNQYFLNMQEPDGFVMNFVGGDVKKHSDSNRWTDNTVGADGGELHFIKPNAGRSNADMLVFGMNDDRVIRTDPAELKGQYHFIIAEAILSRIMKSSDSAYADQCLDAAVRCYNWCEKREHKNNPGVIGASMHAAIEMYKTTLDEKYKKFAIAQANTLKEFQTDRKEKTISGFYCTDASGSVPYKHIWNGCEELFVLCDMVKRFPANPNVPVWKDMIAGYTQNYLLIIAQKNSFGLVPFGLYANEDPGGNRKTGDYWYRYFMYPEKEWWVGINANVASSGIGLLKAAEVLKDDELKQYAQKQLDWIIGVNPFNSSTIVSVGYNHPQHFPGSTFIPQTPVLPGAVLNGLGGDHNDHPIIGNGDWQISEYWTPMVAYTLWLLAEISESN